jgi:protein gp37
MTKIAYVDETWNVSTGCTPVSPGCLNCYAGDMHRRLRSMGLLKYQQPFVEVRFHAAELLRPAHWRKPRRIFTDSMSDLFHERVTDEQIERVYHTMVCLADWHSYLVVTKRPHRAATWYDWINGFGLGPDGKARDRGKICWGSKERDWPPKNVHLLATCENQFRFDERIQYLLRCPAVVHGVSLEPLLEGINFGPWISLLQWIVVGPETGLVRRTCEYDWIRNIVEQAKAAGVPVFVKALVLGDGRGRSRISYEPSEWPHEVRVRMYPGDRW